MILEVYLPMSSTAESSQVHARIIEFIESSTEKIYMIIGAEEISLYRFLDDILKKIGQQETVFTFSYEIWPGEHSRHFLYRWFQETVSGQACRQQEAWSDFINDQPQLQQQLHLLSTKDLRPLDVRFVEAVRFIAQKLTPEQRLILSVVPLTDIKDETFIDFAKAVLRMLPTNVKLMIGQCHNDILVRQDDFCPSNRLEVNGADASEVDKIRQAYIQTWQGGGVGERLLALLAHLVHPVNLIELADFLKTSKKKLEQVLGSPPFETMISRVGRDGLRIAYPRICRAAGDDRSTIPQENFDTLDKQVIAYYQERLTQDKDYIAALYHSLGLLRLSDSETVAEQTLANYRTKMALGGAEVCEFELNHALQLNGKQDTTRAKLFLALAEVQEEQHRNQEALEALEPAIEILQQTDLPADLQYAFELKGRAAFALREMDQAKTALEESLKLSRELDRAALIADILSQLGYLHYSTQQFDQAEALYQEALEAYDGLCQTDPDQGLRGKASQWSNLGHTCFARGDFTKAEQWHRKALASYESIAVQAYERAAELDEELGEPQVAAQRYANMGHSMYAQRKPELALRAFEKALTRYRDLGSPEGEAAQLSNLGLVKGDQGEFEPAVDYFNQAKSIYNQIGDALNEITQLVRLGHVQRARQDLESARQNYQDAVDQYHSLGYAPGEADTALELGQVCAEMEKFSDAVDFFGQAQGIFADLGHQEKEAMCLMLIGQTYRREGKLEASQTSFEKALDMYQQHDNALGSANVQFQMGLLQFDQQNYDQAEQHYRDALETFRQSEDKEGEANLLANLATLHFQIRQLDQARDEFSQALSLLRKMDHPLGMAGVLSNLSFVHEEAQRFDEAYDCLQEARQIYDQLRMSQEETIIAERLEALEKKAARSLSRLRSEMFPGATDAAPKTTKVKRNQPCPCGSGKKYKKCCGR
jgi:tetratricopeptide (TPR) repeat protein